MREKQIKTAEEDETSAVFLLYNENHAIVAWFNRGSADEQKANEN